MNQLDLGAEVHITLTIKGGTKTDLIVSLGSLNGFIEAGNALGAHFVDQIVSLSNHRAFSVEAFNVDGGVVLDRGGTRNVNEDTIGSTHAVNLVVHILIAHREGRDFHFQHGISGERNFGANFNNRIEGHRAFFLTGGDVDLWRINGVEIGLNDGLGIELGQGLA